MGVHYLVGEISKICNVPIKTLRFYDKIGLLSPCERKGSGSYRYYSEKQIYSLLKIKKLKMLGFSLKEIQTLVKADNTENLIEKVNARLEVINQEIRSLQAQYLEGFSFMKRLSEGHSIIGSADDSIANYFWLESAESIQLVDIQPHPVLFTRSDLPNYQNENINIHRWSEVLTLAEQHGVIPVGSLSVTYHHAALGQFFLQDCDYEIHIAVDRQANDINYKTFGGFKAAVAYHPGSYSNIINAHLRVLQWIYKNNYHVCGNVTEEFIISPLDVIEEDKYLTRIIVPVESALK